MRIFQVTTHVEPVCHSVSSGWLLGMAFYSLVAVSESDMNPHLIHICAHEILLRIPERERLSVEPVLWPWAETVDETSFEKKRARCPKGFTFISKFCEGKSMFCFWQWKSKPHQITRDEHFIFKLQRGRKKNPSSWTNASRCPWM